MESFALKSSPQAQGAVSLTRESTVVVCVAMGYVLGFPATCANDHGYFAMLKMVGFAGKQSDGRSNKEGLQVAPRSQNKGVRL